MAERPPEARISACRAAWVVPISGPPIADGAIVWGPDGILDVGPARDLVGRWGSGIPGAPEPAFVDLGSCAVLPGLVNAHTHLELSWLRGRVPPAATMPEWVRTLMRERRAVPAADDPTIHAEAFVERAIDTAIAEIVATGTVAVADIGNGGSAAGPIDRSPLGAQSVLFREVLGFAVPWPRWWPRPLTSSWLEGLALAVMVSRVAGRGPAGIGRPRWPGGLRIGVAAHAPYSVAPALFREVARRARRSEPAWASVHLAESPEEVAWLDHGGGPWRTLLEDLGVWREGWKAPSCGPVEYLERVGFAHQRMVCVHGTELNEAELERLAAWEATLVTCPRSNRWVGVGDPPVAKFFASGVAVAVGTDSLASNADLNLFAEVAALRRLAPEVPPRRLLEAATQGGARVVGLEGTHGAIAPGFDARLVVVDVPPGASDVEAALVDGIDPGRIRAIDGAMAAAAEHARGTA